MRIETGVAQLPEFLQSRKRDGRQAEKERKRGRFGAFETEEQRRRQRRAGARNTGDQRAHLADADDDRVQEVPVFHLALVTGGQFRHGQQKRHAEAGPADHPEAAQRCVAGIEGGRQQHPEHNDRNGPQHDCQRELEIPVAPVAPDGGGQRSKHQSADIAPEITDHGGECRELHGRRKRGARIAPAQQRGHEAHMRGRRNRHQLGNALHHAQNRDLRVAKAHEARIEAIHARGGHCPSLCPCDNS